MESRIIMFFAAFIIAVTLGQNASCSYLPRRSKHIRTACFPRISDRNLAAPVYSLTNASATGTAMVTGSSDSKFCCFVFQDTVEEAWWAS